MNGSRRDGFRTEHSQPARSSFPSDSTRPGFERGPDPEAGSARLYLFVPLFIILLSALTLMLVLVEGNPPPSPTEAVSDSAPEKQLTTRKSPENLEQTVHDELKRELRKFRSRLSRFDIEVFLGPNNLDIYFRLLRLKLTREVISYRKRNGEFPGDETVWDWTKDYFGRIAREAFETLGGTRRKQFNEILVRGLLKLDEDELERAKQILSRGQGPITTMDNREGLEIIQLIIKGLKRLNQDQRNHLYSLWDRALHHYETNLKSYQ